MHASLVILALATLSNAVIYENETRLEFHEKQAKLISHLFSGYRKEVPPISLRDRYSSIAIEPLVVNITLAYAKLLSVNEPNQTIDMIIDYLLIWNDVRLSWNPANFDEIRGLLIDRDLIWRADFLSSESSSTVDTREYQLQHAYVKCDGNIELYVSNAISFQCSPNVEMFPFDEQVCSITFGSFDFSYTELQLNAGVAESYNKSSASSGVWTVSGPRARVYLKGNTSKATYEFHLQRSWGFYVVVIILPSFLLTLLCVVGMFRSKSDRTNYLGKLGLGFTTVLAMCTILQIVETSVPKAKQLPTLSLYVMLNLIILAVAISVIVMSSETCSLSKLGLNIKTKKWLRRFYKNPCVNFHVVCLILFSLATIVNLLELLSNVRKCMKCKTVYNSLK